MSRMNDDELKDLLGDLPRHTASPGFTERVVSRVDGAILREGARRRVVAQRRWLAAAATLALALWWSFGAWNDTGRVQSADRVQELRSEYQALQDELKQLRELAEELAPVIEMGRADEPGLLFDFGVPGERAQEGGASDALPASLNGSVRAGERQPY